MKYFKYWKQILSNLEYSYNWRRNKNLSWYIETKAICIYKPAFQKIIKEILHAEENEHIDERMEIIISQEMSR
jgi:hypothetical protein